MTTTKIMAIVGSLRSDSVNGGVARAAIAAAAPDVTIDMFDVADIPLYNGDIEAAGLPDAVTALHQAVAAADGLIIFSPEYNGSFPAVTKNAIDWMSRPPRSWEGTAVTMVTASPGPRAGVGVRSHFEAIMEHQPVRVMPTLGIGSYPEKTAGSELTDQATLAELATFVASFAAFANQDTA